MHQVLHFGTTKLIFFHSLLIYQRKDRFLFYDQHEINVKLNWLKHTLHQNMVGIVF